MRTFSVHLSGALAVATLLALPPTAEARKPRDEPGSSKEATLTPSDRVRAFQTDYARIHGGAVAAFAGNVDFEQWRTLVAGLDATHFADGAGMKLGNTFSGQADEHAPDHERIVGETPSGDRVLVETVVDGGIAKFYEYELVEVDGDWRIARIRSFFTTPDAPFLKPDARALYLDPPVKPLRPAEPFIQVNGDRLFQDGRTVENDGQASTLAVRRVGMLHVTSGVLVTGDLGYDATLLEPLTQRVAPGRYPAEVSVAYERTAALRVRFSDAEVVEWRPADGPGGGHIIGVDAANVAILDASAVLGVTARGKDRAFEAFVDAPALPYAAMLSLASEDDGVLASSGFGDGAYPSYWGLDATGAPVQLLVDFLVLAEFIEATIEVPMKGGTLAASEALAAHGITLALSGDATATRLRLHTDGGRLNLAELLDADGNVLADTQRSVEITYQGPRVEYTWKDPGLLAKVARVRATVPAGRRN